MIRKLILIYILFFLVACGKENNAPSAKFNVEELRKDFIQKIETPATNKLVTDIKALNTAIKTFATKINEQNLTSLKNAWKIAAITFSENEILNIGKVETSNAQLGIYDWGAKESSIENYITSTNPITESAINSKPSNIRGLSAIEYLLFEKTATETIADFSNQRRTDYLKILGENLIRYANSINTKWSNSRKEFITNNSTGINGGVNKIINQMNALLEDIRRFKIGEPAGIENVTIADATRLQADKSQTSLKLIEKNIAAIKNVYFGVPNGIDDYIAHVSKNKTINKTVLNKFTAIESNITSIGETSLKNAVTSKPDAIKKLHESIKELILVIKTDVASALSITITFTDNDGD